MAGVALVLLAYVSTFLVACDDGVGAPVPENQVHSHLDLPLSGVHNGTHSDDGTVYPETPAVPPA